MKNRKKVEEYILKYIYEITKDDHNVNLYKNTFKEMNDREFHKLMEDLKSGKQILSIVVPNYGKAKLDVDRNLKIGKQLGVEFFQRVYMESSDGSVEYLSPQEFLVYDLPARRTAQHLLKGIRTPDNNRKRDAITGQVINDSQSAKISYPELLILNGLNLPKTMKELMSIRGGDAGAMNALEAFISKYGSVTQENLEGFANGTGSTNTLKAFFKAAHLKLDNK